MLPNTNIQLNTQTNKKVEFLKFRIPSHIVIGESKEAVLLLFGDSTVWIKKTLLTLSDFKSFITISLPTHFDFEFKTGNETTKLNAKQFVDLGYKSFPRLNQK